jgi:FKBP-type peptidyl-prolyl cis-trans isomerase
MNKVYLPVFLCLLLLATGCDTEEETEFDKQARIDNDIIRAYLDQKDIAAEQSDNGLYYVRLKENPGGAQLREGDVAGILYEMKNLAGSYPVETHADTLHPLRFSYTAESLVPRGLNYDIGLMRTGEVFRFYIPSVQAFNNYRHEGLFGANTNFIIDVALVSIESEQEVYTQELDSVRSFLSHQSWQADEVLNGLFYIETDVGEGLSPNIRGGVTFHYTRKYLDGSVIETTTTGEPVQLYFSENRMVPGLREGILRMAAGGKSILVMPSRLAFGKSVQVIPQSMRRQLANSQQIEPETAPYSSVMYEVELLNVF